MLEGFKIWFSGTRYGMTEKQKIALKEFLAHVGLVQFQHGDCVGADEESHNIVLELGAPIVIRPPKNPALRAYCKGAQVVMPPEEYLVRNRRGVDDTEMVVAAPFEEEEQRNGGTWRTIRYAASKKKIVIVITPKGLLKNYPF